MSISDLGAIGEFVGSLAVLATLAYLTIQTRAARISTDLQTTLSVVTINAMATSAILSSNPESFKAVAKAAAGTTLEGPELLTYGQVMQVQVVQPLAAILQSAPSATRTRVLAGFENYLGSVWDDPNFRKLWEGGFWSKSTDSVIGFIESYKESASRPNGDLS